MRKNLLTFIACFLVAVTSCTNSNASSEQTYNVHFNTCIQLETNFIKDQTVKKGGRVEEPAVHLINDSDYDQKISGWYTEKSYVNKWDFLSNTVERDLNLFAKWVDIISISYYLKGSTTPIWTVADACSGEPLERHDELCDGYEFYGYFTDSACTIPFDLETPLNEDTKVYLYRGENLSLNPGSIKRRFSMQAAGGSGSTAGNISEVKIDEATGVECVDVNFGYSTSADPYMFITNPTIDISKSQKLKMKFKNFGGATNISFYWVSKYEDGNYASGYQVDSEANSAHFRINTYECYMSEDDPWMEKEFDLSNTITNGISPWGNSTTLVRLRIQFSYVSRNQNDLSNVVRIASITSVSDDSNVGFKDTQQIKDLLHDDNEAELTTAANRQEQNRGVIFPKNNDKILNTSTQYYKKTDGLLMYSNYGEDIRRYFFDVSDQNIEASDYSYINVKFKNYSYIPSFSLYVVTENPKTGGKLTSVATVSMPIRMKTFDDSNLNFFTKTNMYGKVLSFQIMFNYNGVDNAILLESITMSESRPFQIPGINFNDPNHAGFKSNSDLALTYDTKNDATEFEVLSDAATTSYKYDYSFDIEPYKDIKLNFLLKEEGVNKIEVYLKINGLTKVYTFDGLTKGNKIQSLSLPLKDTGLIEDVSLTLYGQGKITLTTIEFVLDQASSVDFSNPITRAGMLEDWAEGIAYTEDNRALLYKSPEKMLRYYIGYLSKEGKREHGNISLEGKSYIYIVYQNTKSYGEIQMSLFATNINEHSEVLTDFNENQAMLPNQVFELEKNMNPNSWAVAKLAIPANHTTGLHYLSNFFLTSVGGAKVNISIRGIGVI